MDKNSGEVCTHYRLILSLSRQFKCQTATARDLCSLKGKSAETVQFLCDCFLQFSGQRDQIKILFCCCYLILCDVLFLHFLCIFFVIVCFLEAIVL